MFSIGEFSKLARVSLKALRLYDAMGLLRPARVDAASGYRYYSASQLARLNRILVLKELGFALERISPLLEASLSVAELEGMLRLRREEQRSEAAEAAARLESIEQVIEELKREGEFMEAMIKMTSPAWAVTLTRRVPAYNEVGSLYPEVYEQVGAKAEGSIPIAIWHDSGPQEQGVLAEAGVLMKEPMPVQGALQCYELPVVEVAAFVHRGSYAGIKGAFGRLMAWMEERGWSLAGPPRELYLYFRFPVRQDDESYVTEIQIPVRKAD